MTDEAIEETPLHNNLVIVCNMRFVLVRQIRTREALQESIDALQDAIRRFTEARNDMSEHLYREQMRDARDEDARDDDEVVNTND